MHPDLDFILSFVLKVMISTCQHFYDNSSFTGIFNRLIFDRVYGSWIFSLLSFTVVTTFMAIIILLILLTHLRN